MPQLGTKHECVECGTRFYDLGRPAAVCPACGTDQNEALPDQEPSELTSGKSEIENLEEEEIPEDLEEDLFDEEFQEGEEDALLDEEDLLDEF
ncbi:MAG: FYDLN acid domain-containing protein [Thermoanaerobaculia bacterium]|nr:FYDLN acid domain-containing protein [Thermoanaerobaculia bacterium]